MPSRVKQTYKPIFIAAMRAVILDREELDHI